MPNGLDGVSSVRTLKTKLIAAARRAFGRPERSSDRFLQEVAGVIHVGANAGQERDDYAAFDLNVAWIEPIPEVYRQLRSHVSAFPRQKAYQRLITDQDQREYVFHVADNNGASSSILPLAMHTKLWPEISYSHDIKLVSATLDAFVISEQLNLDAFEALVLDTQGSEMMVLRGAADVLRRVRFVKIEAPDFEAYTGCCLLRELETFMTARGFRERERRPLRSGPGVGTYYDVLYERAPSGDLG